MGSLLIVYFESHGLMFSLVGWKMIGVYIPVDFSCAEGSVEKILKSITDLNLLMMPMLTQGLHPGLTKRMEILKLYHVS